MWIGEHDKDESLLHNERVLKGYTSQNMLMIDDIKGLLLFMRAPPINCMESPDHKTWSNPLKIMNEIFQRYSHYRLTEFFKHESIKILFECFAYNYKHKFISEIAEAGLRDQYEDAFNDFHSNFEKHSDYC